MRGLGQGARGLGRGQRLTQGGFMMRLYGAPCGTGLNLVAAAQVNVVAIVTTNIMVHASQDVFEG